MNKADNLPMSAEEWFEENYKGYSITQIRNTTLMNGYAEYREKFLLSHHINVLAERIAEKTQRVDIQGHGVCDVIDKKEILKIAKDYINELNLQSSK